MIRIGDAKLIRPDKITSILPISKNHNPKNLNIAILEAQHRYVKPHLTGTLYRTLLEAVVANLDPTPGSTFDGDQEILVDDYIAPVLRWGVMKELLEIEFLDLRDNGITRSSDANSAVARKDEINSQVEIIREKLGGAQALLIEYLDDAGEATFPQLGENQNLASDDRDTTDYNEGPGFVASQRGQYSGIDAIDDYEQNRR